MKNTIECPKCSCQIDVDQALVEKVKKDLSSDYRAKLEQLDEDHQQKLDGLKSKEQELKLKEENQQLLLEEKIKEKELEISKKLQSQLQSDFEQKMSALEEEVEKKSGKIKELQKQEIVLRKQQRELEEKEAALELEITKKLDEERISLTEKIQRQEQEKAFMKLKEKDQLVETLSRQIEDLKRKADQGSMQSQGEIMELEIESMLHSNYPFDLIEEVKKGASGADVIQKVRTNFGKEAGIIAYESKRTKRFGEDWIGKLKNDMQIHKADIGVIVTEVMPKDMPRFGVKNGIWICSFHDAPGLSAVLREALLRIAEAKSSQENKGDKMHMLYDYLTGTEFNQQIQSIVEGFSKMKTDLDKERKAMMRIWKEREKQIEKVTVNTIDMYSSFKGIAGSAVGEIPELSLNSSQNQIG